MTFLADTDESFAHAKADVLRLEIFAKRVRARLFMTSEGSVELRKAMAEGHAETAEADDKLVGATVAYETLRAKRQRAEIVIDVWRSIEASRRKT